MNNVILGENEVLSPAVSQSAMQILQVVTDSTANSTATAPDPDVVLGVLGAVDSLFEAQLKNRVCGEAPAVAENNVCLKSIGINN